MQLLKNRWVQLLVVIVVFWMLFNPVYLLQRSLTGDDASYVSHAFTIALDGDLSYCNELAYDSAGCASGTVRTVPPHPIGTGIVHAPVIAVFSIIDRLSGHPVIQDHRLFAGSFSYFGFFIGSVSFFILGLWLYYKALQVVFEHLPRWKILLLTAGYGMPFYVFQRFTMSHSAEFLFLALVFWTSMRLLNVNGKNRYFLIVILPVSIAVIYLIRPANINAVLIPPIVFLVSSISIVDKPVSIFRSRTEWSLFLFSLFGAISIVMLINQQLYQHVFPDSTQMYGFKINRIPESMQEKLTTLLLSVKYLPVVLFSSEFGLLFSAPVLFIGIIGIFYACFQIKNNIRILIAVSLIILYVGLPVSIVLLWKTAASSYGYRYLFSLAPIAILGFCFVEEMVTSSKGKIFKRVLFSLTVFAIVGQIFFMTDQSLSTSKKINVFGREDIYSANGYEKEVLKATISPKSWVKAAIKRFPGFLAISVIKYADIYQFSDKMAVPREKIDTQVQLHRQVGTGYLFIIIICAFLIPIIIWYIVFESDTIKQTIN